METIALARPSRPRLGWQHVHLMGLPLDDPVAPERFIEICADVGIVDDAQLEAVRHKLRHATNHFRTLQHNADGRPLPRESTALFDEMADHCERLETLLREMDGVSHDYFWKAEQALHQRCWTGECAEMEEIGAYRRFEGEPEVNKPIAEYIARDDAFIGVRYLALLARKARESVPSRRRGRRERIAIRLWVLSLCDFLESDLGWRITHDEHRLNKMPPTERLLRALMREIDPDEERYVKRAITVWRAGRRRST